MNALTLMLADSRFPGGGHAHSGGLEEAASRGLVRREDDLPAFLRGRLRTAGTLAATFAAASATECPEWSTLDAELDARTPSAAQRAASRAQGRATARAAKIMGAATGLLAVTPRPHHPIVLGALVGVPADAALAAAYLSISGAASAGVRLLGLDPLRVNEIVAALAGEVEAVAARAAAGAHLPPAELAAPGSPGLDLLAEEHDRHHREEVRLFVS
jgi:urease accessory protein